MIISDTDINTKAAVTDVGSAWSGYLLNQLALRIRQSTVAALQPLGITPPQLRALEAVAAESPLNQARLGELVHLDRTTVVHVVDRFESLGIAKRQPDASDRRSHTIVLTDHGRDVLRDARLCARKAERDFLSPLSGEERATLHMLLSRLFDPEPEPVPEPRNKPIPCPEESI